MKTLTISLPEEVELYKVKMIIAASLFERGILSSGQAAELVGITRREFLEEVGKFGGTIFGETAEDIAKVAEIEL
jgi:predicted HTH domain antitoxin